MSRRTTLRDLPGWDQAVKEIRDLGWGRSSDMKMLSHCGDHLRVIGAFVAPPSITSMSSSLLKAMVVGMIRHRMLEGYKVEAAAKVVVMKDWLERRLYQHPRIRGDWRDHWTGRPGVGDTEL